MPFVLVLLPLVAAVTASASESKSSTSSPSKAVQVQCLNAGQGFLQARLSGAINREIHWGQGMACEGSMRPNGGVRLKFSQPGPASHPMVLLFGISGIHAGQDGKVLATNVTIMREGKGEFYSTQGDKCVVDELKQRLQPGPPTKKRIYLVEAHGFCNQPARALRGDGSVLVTRFDFVGRLDITAEDDSSFNMVAGT